MKPTRPTVAEISLRAIDHNFQEIQKKVGQHVGIMAVVKANAYGHGDVEIAKFLERRGTNYFGVAFPEEGVRLREAGIKKPIHVFTLPARSQAALYVDFKLEATVCTLDDAVALGTGAAKLRGQIPVHLKVETGMNRIGVRPQDLEELVRAVGRIRRLEVKGLFTHFATSDDKDGTFARRQLSEFHKGMEVLQRAKVEPECIHCANSGAILHLPESYFTMVRPGIMMYGYFPSKRISSTVSVVPALCLKTYVAFVKWIHAGESVSYGRKFIAQKRTRIATLPLGYADGYPRTLTNKTFALINGNRLPVVGAICMDQLMVDVGSSDVKAGDEAILIGEQREHRIGAWDLAEKIGTIPYEVLTNISSRVPRVYMKT